MNKAAASDTLLLSAVPSSISTDADSALLSLGSPELQTTPHLIQDTHSGVPQRPGILIEGQLVQTPYRVYYAWPEPRRTRQLNQTQLRVLWAWMTRNADGRIRQKALRKLLQEDAPWTIPYVIQLCGEYVVEIGADVLQFLTTELPKRPKTSPVIQAVHRRQPNVREAHRTKSLELLECLRPMAICPGRLPPASSPPTLG